MSLTRELTHEDIKHLRRPFTPEAVKWRIDQKEPDRAGSVRCLCYIDSRLAMERLSEVDPCWTAEYEFLARNMGDPVGVTHYAPTLCTLTVKGIRRSDIGTISTTKAGAKEPKSAISDAIKRAAVQYHIGAYLYAMPTFKVDEKGYWKKGNGTLGGLTPAGVKQLRQQYTKVVTHPKFAERHGEPIDYGDVADDERSTTPETHEHEQVAQTSFATEPAGRRVTQGAAR